MYQNKSDYVETLHTIYDLQFCQKIAIEDQRKQKSTFRKTKY